MSTTKPISIDTDAPGEQTFTYAVDGVAPDMSSGWVASMHFWRAGISTIESSEFSLDESSGITLGAAGAITVDYVVVEAGLVAVSALDANWYYTLIIEETGFHAKRILSGPFIRMMP